MESKKMVRISKKDERRAKSPRKHKKPSKKTGPKVDNLPEGYRVHQNALEGDMSQHIFIGKVK